VLFLLHSLATITSLAGDVLLNVGDGDVVVVIILITHHYHQDFRNTLAFDIDNDDDEDNVAAIDVTAVAGLLCIFCCCCLCSFLFILIFQLVSPTLFLHAHSFFVKAARCGVWWFHYSFIHSFIHHSLCFFLLRCDVFSSSSTQSPKRLNADYLMLPLTNSHAFSPDAGAASRTCPRKQHQKQLT
jgi:hypothetical protein